jgi:hypothetical protein
MHSITTNITIKAVTRSVTHVSSATFAELLYEMSTQALVCACKLKASTVIQYTPCMQTHVPELNERGSRRGSSSAPSLLLLCALSDDVSSPL